MKRRDLTCEKDVLERSSSEFEGTSSCPVTVSLKPCKPC